MNSLTTNNSLKIYSDPLTASKYVAQRIADIIVKKQQAGKPAVLGLATGNTPTNVYKELINMHKNNGLSFKNVISFNLDEYYPMQPVHDQSYVLFMNNNLFDHIDIIRENVFIPDGTIKNDDVLAFCRSYEQKIIDLGGLDLQLLGIGQTGHIGFNEPGSLPDSVTRLVNLNNITREDAVNDFGNIENVPVQAITMGIDTILKAKNIILLAWGNHKATIIQKALTGIVTSNVPASYLQNCSHVEFVLDKEAASLL